MKHKRHTLTHLAILLGLLLSLVAAPVEADPLNKEISGSQTFTGIFEPGFDVITRASVASDGTQTNWHSDSVAYSADGRYVAFVTEADNLVPGDTGGYADVFVHDLTSRQTTRVSVSTNGQQGNGNSISPTISADGRYIAFSSEASNLVAGDANNLPDIFLHDRLEQTTILISVGPDGQPLPGSSHVPAISPDGRYISFNAHDSLILIGIIRSHNDIFIYDRNTGQSECISVGYDGLPVNRWGGGTKYRSAVSSNGDYVAFISQARNLVPTDYSGSWEIFVRDRQLSQTSIVTINTDGTPAEHPLTNYDRVFPAISSDGRYIAFESNASNLVSSDINEGWDVFIHDRLENTTTRVSVASDGTEANYRLPDYGSGSPSLSSDGRYIAYHSNADNLVTGDTNDMVDNFLHDQITGSTRLVSRNSQGIQGNSSSVEPRLSADGRYIAFLSVATNLVSNDTNGAMDVFVRDNLAISTPDIGFRPDPHGYSFANYGGAYPLPPALGDFTMQDMRRLYGDACVCRMVDGRCEIDYPVRLRLLMLNLKMNSGHCTGMALTSSRFFYGMDHPGDFQAGAISTFDLEKTAVRRHIAYNHVKQYSESVSVYRAQILNNPPSTILDYLQSYLSASPSEPVLIEVWKSYLDEGHAITPYAIEPLSENVYAVMVYDSNHEDDENRFVTIDTINETWSYDLGSPLGTWEGDASTHTLAVLPLWLYGETVPCPGSTQQSTGVNDISTGEVWLEGDGSLLISDSQGRMIGFEGDQYHQEIPGAIGMPSPGGLGIDSEPVYILPLTDSYTILLDGHSLTQAEEVSVTQFGPGYAARVEEITLQPDSQDELTIANDGQSISYFSEDNKDLTLSLAWSDSATSHQFQVKGANLNAGETVALSAITASGRIIIDHSLAGAGKYTLTIDRLDANGEQNFLHTNIPISATDTHYINYTDWDGSGALTLQIDQGSDGSIDSSVELTNMSHRIFLPINIKKD